MRASEENRLGEGAEVGEFPVTVWSTGATSNVVEGDAKVTEVEVAVELKAVDTGDCTTGDATKVAVGFTGALVVPDVEGSTDGGGEDFKRSKS